MYIKAISIGYAVPHTDFDATVHSVFRSAVNLRLPGENRLLTLLASSEADLPQGILTNTPKGFSFEGLPIGSQGTCRGGVLNLENSLSIDLRRARCWECDLLSLDADMTNLTVVIAWRCVWRALNDRQVCYGAEVVGADLLYPNAKKQSVLIKQLSKSLRNIFKATRQYDLTDVGGVGALIGLGPGLTPSGDDLLTGYMAGLWCTTKGRSERLNFLSVLGEVVIRLSKGTNDISRTYLYHAACGQVSSRLVNLASAICAGSDPQHVRDCAKSAMQVGHTSGMDAVTGLLFGLVIWDRLCSGPIKLDSTLRGRIDVQKRGSLQGLPCLSLPHPLTLPNTAASQDIFQAFQANKTIRLTPAPTAGYMILSNTRTNENEVIV